MQIMISYWQFVRSTKYCWRLEVGYELELKHNDPWSPLHRQRNKIRRNDLIDLMLDAVEDEKKEIDEVINWKIVI